MLRVLRLTLERRAVYAMMLIMAAMVVRVVVPEGYMPTVSGKHIVIALCSGHGPVEASVTIPVKGGGKGHADDSPAHHGNDTVCPFASLMLGATAAADPLQLALALLFIVRSVFRLARLPVASTCRNLWPPRTGPPLIA